MADEMTQPLATKLLTRVKVNVSSLFCNMGKYFRN